VVFRSGIRLPGVVFRNCTRLPGVVCPHFVPYAEDPVYVHAWGVVDFLDRKNCLSFALFLN